MLRRLLAGLLLIMLSFAPVAAPAQPLRVAVFNAGLTRDGPGLLLRDIRAGDDPQVIAAAEIILAKRPDILLLLGFDHDVEHRALTAFRALLLLGTPAAQGIEYLYKFSPAQNVGLQSDLDLDGDGRRRGPADAFGFGAFRGQGGMAILSRLPLDVRASRDFSTVLWRDLAEPDLPVRPDGSPFPSAAAQAAMRLSTTGHWDVPVILPGGRRLHLLVNHSVPPVFDGPEDANGRRNRDELRFWQQYLEGRAFRTARGQEQKFAGGPYVLLAGLNIDPQDGDGARDELRSLLARGLFRDPGPSSLGASIAAFDQAGVAAAHASVPEQDTVDWPENSGPGNLRVDYVLPSPGLFVLGAGVFWPAPWDAGGDLVERGQELGIRHRLVWVDLE